jgi:ATP-dependent exoDNAse (exonuclease V) beta subunit
MIEWTAEQLAAIERRDGDLFLDANAGSGKTSVLAERFVRAVLEDGVEVSAILTITFTEKAAAEMRERIRLRLGEVGAHEAARATDGAFISTIHGFCARLLRAGAVQAGVDPAFRVLDELEAARLSGAAFDEGIEKLAESAPQAVELIAAYGASALRGSIVAIHEQLRSRGQVHPTLPPLERSADLSTARRELEQAAQDTVRELEAIGAPGARVLAARERLARCDELTAADDPWPGDLESAALPKGNGAALATPVCEAYTEALSRFRAACEHVRAQRAHALLDRLLRDYHACYERRKRGCSGLDFEDLELMALELLRSQPELRERYRSRFAHIMVDELQDTNAVQLELIELLAQGRLFTVGDAQQSIYGFRHADIELFEERGARLGAVGARATLATNFRSRQEILEVLNAAFSEQLERFTPLRAGRTDPGPGEPRVELLVVEKDGDWSPEALAAPWRVAEARVLSARVAELLAGGIAPRGVVLLARATTDLRAYERALEERGIPTYLIGGRGYWSHPQVVDMVCYLRALANPRDEEALYTVLASPLVGASFDALVVLAAAGRVAERDPWWVLREHVEALDELGGEDRERLSSFARWFAEERRSAERKGIDELIEHALERTGYDLAVLAMPGGQRRLANVRKLMRLASEHETAAGRDLRGFLELVRFRSGEGARADARESEAPVEGEALDAVRLMTIHRAKGLEFQNVCVADLGRGPRPRADLMRVGRDGRFGLRLAQPGSGKREPALDYKLLGEEQLQAEAAEERRLFYVAMTRACERLILSGAARLEPWATPNGGAAAPIAWIGPAMLGDVEGAVSEGSGVTEGRVRFAFYRPSEVEDLTRHLHDSHPPPSSTAPPLPPSPPPAKRTASASPGVTSLSYSSLAEYERCGYRFYVERILGVPARDVGGVGRARGLRGAERGLVVHSLLERLSFRRPVLPSDEDIVGAGGGVLGA